MPFKYMIFFIILIIHDYFYAIAVNFYKYRFCLNGILHLATRNIIGSIILLMKIEEKINKKS